MLDSRLRGNDKRGKFMESVLSLSVGGLPPLSAKGCVQTLTPIQLGKMVRTINGELLHVGPKELKYQSVISAKDKTVLASNGLTPGVHVRVGCISRLFEKVTSSPHTLMREGIEGSVAVMDEDQKSIAFTLQERQVFTEKKGSYFVSYRPYLDMRVVDFEFKTNEWTMESEWMLKLEEI